jgi:hypothetical protein
MEDTDFLAHATEIVNDLESELRRVCPEDRARWRALEIGCGSGLLMRPMSRHFLELYGVDPSPVRIEQARAYLQDVSNIRLQERDADGLPLSRLTEDAHFDFVYSLEAGFDALPWMEHALSDGGLTRLRFNGLQRTRQEVLEFAAEHDFQVLAIQGTGTRSMWTTWKKRPSGWYKNVKPPANRVLIRRITNASSNEPVAPSRGRFASISVFVEQLPDDADLNRLRVAVGDSFGTVTYIGSADRAGSQRVRVDLPELEETGLLPIRLLWSQMGIEQPISEPHTLRVIPPGPAVPKILGVSRGMNARMVRFTIEDVARPYDLDVSVGGLPVVGLEYECTDPKPQRFDVTFQLPDEIGHGMHHLHVALGRRNLAPVPLRVN